MENSTFNGSFSVNFTSGAKGDAAAVPSLTPCTGQIGDFLWNDANRNGIQNPGEAGIDGVTIRLRNSAGALLATTTTGLGPINQHGYFQFSALCAGGYRIEVDATTLPPGMVASPSRIGANRAIDSNGSPATLTFLTNSSVDQTIDFGYNTACIGSIGDFIWNDLNRNGIQDAGEPGINSVRVELLNYLGISIGAAISGPNGAFKFQGLCAGTYTVRTQPALRLPLMRAAI